VILYLDTSALVKLYIQEVDAALVRDASDAARFVATSEIAYVELRSALARRLHERGIALSDYRRAIARLQTDWGAILSVALDSPLIRRAGNVAEGYTLRAYDAVHLASALLVAEREENKGRFVFACWDRNLSAAATRAGLRLLKPLGRMA
jgi:predicted nucleic acid-binding protein